MKFSFLRCLQTCTRNIYFFKTHFWASWIFSLPFLILIGFRSLLFFYTISSICEKVKSKEGYILGCILTEQLNDQQNGVPSWLEVCPDRGSVLYFIVVRSVPGVRQELAQDPLRRVPRPRGVVHGLRPAEFRAAGQERTHRHQRQHHRRQAGQQRPHRAGQCVYSVRGAVRVC